jgi:hypothetical protein
LVIKESIENETKLSNITGADHSPVTGETAGATAIAA